MSNNKIIALILFISSFCSAQHTKGKTVVFKVKAPLATCNINSDDSNFFLEKESDVDIVVKGRNAKTKVTIIGGEIRSVKELTDGRQGSRYRLRFLTIGTVVVKVFQIIPTGTKLIATKSFEVKPPTFFFCGLKVDSSSTMLRMGNCHMYVYSSYYKQKLPVNKFTMLYYQTADSKREKPILDTLKSDDCKMTNAMRLRFKQFKPKSCRIYFYNLLCSVPDGSYRLLEPVELSAIMDTIPNSYKVVYTLKKKKLD